MARAVQFTPEVLSLDGSAKEESRLFSTTSVLNLEKLIFAGSPLSEVLTNIAQLVESRAEGMSCTIWIPDQDGKELHCAAAPSLPGFSASVGTMAVCPKGASCGTALYRRESVYVTDILTDRSRQPRMLILWGKNDPFFTVEGAKAYQRDIPGAELHLIDTGHFALEDFGGFIAERMRKFLGQSAAPSAATAA